MSQTRSERIIDEEWEKYRPEIEYHWLQSELKGNDGLIELMKNKHGFIASGKQYEYRLKKWGIHKNKKRDDWALIHEILEVRESRNEESIVLIHGRQVPEDKLKRERKRYRRSHTQRRSAQHLPSHIQIVPSLSLLSRVGETTSVPSAEIEHTNPSHQHTSGSVTICSPRFSAPENELSSFSMPSHDLNGFLSELRSGLNVENSGLFFEEPLSSTLQFASNLGSSLYGEWLINPLNGSGQRSPFIDDLSDSLVAFLDGVRITASPIFNEFAKHLIDPQMFIAMSQVLHSPKTTALLRNSRQDLQLVYTAISAVANNVIDLGNLQNPASLMNMHVKKMILSLDGLDKESVNHVLNTFPQPFRSSFERGLFPAAVEIGASRVVDVVLDRGLDLHSVKIIINDRSYTPLLRASIKGVITVLRSILNRSKKSDIQSAFNSLLFDEGKWREKPGAELLEAFLRRGVRMDRALIVNVFRAFKPEHISRTIVLYTSIDDTLALYDFDVLIDLFRFCDNNEAVEIVSEMLSPERYARLRNPENFLPEKLTIMLNKTIQTHRFEAATRLLEKNARPDFETLFFAIKSENIDIVELVLQTEVLQPQDDPKKPYDLALAIAWAFRIYSIPMFDVLNRYGLMSVLKTSGRALVLSMSAACETGNQQLLEHLLSERQNLDMEPFFIDITDDPYGAALRNNNDSLIPILMQHGLQPSIRDLEEIIRLRRPEVARTMLEMLIAGNPLELANAFAIHAKYPDIVRSLVDAGTDLNYHLRPYQYPFVGGVQWPFDIKGVCCVLSIAIFGGDQETIDLLLELGAPVNCSSDSNDSSLPHLTPLFAALHVRNNSLIQNLIVRGATLDDPNMFLKCVETDNDGALQMLIDASKLSGVNSIKARTAPALGYAISRGIMPTTKKLAPFADIDALAMSDQSVERVLPFRQRDTAIFSAFGSAISSPRVTRTQMVQELLLFGPKMHKAACRHYRDFLPCFNETPLLVAIRMRDLSVVQLLVSANADIHAHPKLGVIRTPLQAAVEIGAWDIIHFLLERGVDVNAPPAISNGRTALQIAAEKGFIGIASLLISKKADVNAPAGQFLGRTAFEAAAEHGRIEMLMFLVENGADIVSDGGKQYKNALRFAKFNGHTGIDIYVKDVYQKQCFFQSAMNTAPLETGESSESFQFDPRMFL